MVVTNPCSIINPADLFRQSNDDAQLRGGLYRSFSCNSENSSLSMEENHQEQNDEQASPLLKLMWSANSFMTQGLQSRKGGPCLPLMVGRIQIGILRSDVVDVLQRYPHVFICTPCSVSINPQLDTPESRTTAVDEVLRHVRLTGETAALRSWRDEKFAVWGPNFSQPLLAVERSAMALLGIRAFGVHLTGYARTPEGSIAGVWLQKRADNKPTYPGMMDTMVAGGMGDSLTPSQVGTITDFTSLRTN
ncbi:protein of unknown function DUF4743 [Trinorchestia longiramus]|nr:protein of unknown function DUF4743 [Trinorchestia longiramus]